MDLFNRKKVKTLEKALETERGVSKELTSVLYGSVWGAEEWLQDFEDQLIIESPYDAYKKVSLVAQCINALSFYATRKGFHTTLDHARSEEVLKEINELNRRVNLDNVITMAIIKREIFGRAAYEIVRDTRGDITALLPLMSDAIIPEIDEKTQMIKHFNYSYAKKTGTLAVEDVLYFPRLALHRDRRGRSAVTPIMNVIKLKVTLYRDILESAKRLWAGMAIFGMDTSDLRDPVKIKERLVEFANQLKPGRSIVHNKAVDGKIVDLKPDLQGLIRAWEMADTEIMGNWQMPKAVFSREKTTTKATLNAALNAMYEGPIEGVQRFFKREIERQWYDRIVRKELKLDPKEYAVKHIWNPVIIYDASLIRALAYSVRVGAMTREEFFKTMGWTMLAPTAPVGPPPGEIADIEVEVEEIREQLQTPVEFPEEEQS